ncbi:hypothetical protein ACU4GD_44855 [Cupriavidus basilensis]
MARARQRAAPGTGPVADAGRPGRRRAGAGGAAPRQAEAAAQTALERRTAGASGCGAARGRRVDWLATSRRAGDARAHFLLGKAAFLGTVVVPVARLTPRLLAAFRVRRRRWQCRGRVLPGPAAPRRLRPHARCSRGCPLVRSGRRCRRGAGHVHVSQCLSRRGAGVPRDEGAVAWYEAAAERGASRVDPGAGHGLSVWGAGVEAG